MNASEALLGGWMSRIDAAPEEEPDEGFDSMLSINLGEWLVARGSIHARGGQREINGYLLGRDGPYLTPVQQRWIAQLRERPLRLYRVTEVRPGDGLTLVDELDATAAPVVVREGLGSADAEVGLLMGARVMEVEDIDGSALQVLSGAIYPFAALREPAVLDAVRAAAGGDDADDGNRRDLVESAIAARWLAQWFEPLPMPDLRDASTGDAILLVTDHYRVADAAALAAALAAQPDVSGDPARGWTREVDAEDGVVRGLAAINPGRQADRIEVFYRTQRLADDGRAWFDHIAGPSVVHLTREITDPQGAASQAGGPDGSEAPGASPRSAEELGDAVSQILRRHYANRCDEPIPALDGRTPRQAIATSAGLERVKGLLRQYEEGEARQSAQQGRTAFSYQFLWDRLGISR